MGKLFQPLDAVLSSASKVRLLRALLSVHAPVSGREAASLAGVAVMPAQRALRDLVALGVVLRVQTRSQHLYSPNWESSLVGDALAPLFAAERGRVFAIFEWIGEVLADQAGAPPHAVRSVYVFGSAARGDDSPESDFDLLVLVEAASQVEGVHRHLSDVAPAFASRFGLALSPVVIDLQRWRQMESQGDSLPAAVAREGRRVMGDDLTSGGTW